MACVVTAIDRPDAPSLSLGTRFRHDIVYFATQPGTGGAPDKLGSGEFWVTREDAERCSEDGYLVIVSPLDSAARTELELSEDQERFVEWLLEHDVRHVRVQ